MAKTMVTSSTVTLAKMLLNDTSFGSGKLRAGFEPLTTELQT